MTALFPQTPPSEGKKRRPSPRRALLRQRPQGQLHGHDQDRHGGQPRSLEPVGLCLPRVHGVEEWRVSPPAPSHVPMRPTSSPSRRPMSPRKARSPRTRRATARSIPTTTTAPPTRRRNGSAESSTPTVANAISRTSSARRCSHISEMHLHRYLAEFDFRYSNRIKLGVDHTLRTDRAVRGIEGRGLPIGGPVGHDPKHEARLSAGNPCSSNCSLTRRGSQARVGSVD
jgi:hypothetical protein